MISHDIILYHLSTLSENDISKQILVPMFRKMGLKDPTFIGGPGERGIDILLWEKSLLADRVYTGVQVKKGDIGYSGRGKDESITDLINQAEEAFEKKNHDLNTSASKYISAYLIISTGKITTSAEERIRDKKKYHGFSSHIYFWDGNRLCTYINDYWREEFKQRFSVESTDEDMPSPGRPATYRIARITVDGNTLVTSAEIYQLIKPYEGKILSLSQLGDAASEITKLYHHYGYKKSQAYIPAQDISNQTVVIRVIEEPTTISNKSVNETVSIPSPPIDADFYEQTYPELVKTWKMLNKTCSKYQVTILTGIAFIETRSHRSYVSFQELTQYLSMSMESLELDLKRLQELEYLCFDEHDPEISLDSDATSILNLIEHIWEHVSSEEDCKALLDELCW